MKKSRLSILSASISVFALASCAYIFPEKSTTAAEPFIDPAILAKNKCASPPSPVKSANEDVKKKAVVFDYAAPFALPTEITANFHYPISTQNEDTQKWFDTGLTHMANFNHDEAIAAFRKAQEMDADCAMCFWGEALSFGSNINAPFDEARGTAGLVASEKALERIKNSSDLETALILALSKRYAQLDDGSVVENGQSYANAMDKVALEYTEDKVVLSLAAEANMNTQPWDYWEIGARAPKGRTARTVEMLETALQIDPEFAPAIHLYIHATEASVDPYRAKSYADRLAQQSLGVGHLVHMPSHIYLRLGDWKNSHKANIDAIAADEAYIAASKNAQAYADVYYPHNVHFLVANAQLGGDGQTAIEMADKLQKIAVLDPSLPNPFGEHIAAAPILTEIQFGSLENIMNTAPPPEAHLYVRTAWYYARGLSQAKTGDISNANSELAQLVELEEHSDFGTYEAYGVPVSKIAKVARLSLQGQILAADGNLTDAINVLDEAAEAQDQLSYMEPAWWYNHTRQTLGALLIQDGQFERAEREFYKTLINSPNNAYALFGLAEAFKAQGDSQSEKYARHLFDQAWIGTAGSTPKLSDL